MILNSEMSKNSLKVILAAMFVCGNHISRVSFLPRSYFVRATVRRRMADIVSEKDVWVYSYKIPPEINDSIKMEVGIEDCLHIEFEYSKSKYLLANPPCSHYSFIFRYHLKDVIVGKIYFLLVRIKIKLMELSIIQRETVGVGLKVQVVVTRRVVASSQMNDHETISKFEIMDGAPVRGETIPIRLFLNGLKLTPTHRDVDKKFSTRYYLNLVLIDEENRRYFKQQEVTLFRLQSADEQPL